MTSVAPVGWDWDDERAARLVGKYALVGLTRLDADGETIIAQEQVHGVITMGDAREGIRIVCRGEGAGRTVKLPPDMRGLAAAEPGHYRLHSTGEVVVDPDVTLSWAIRRAPN